MDRGAWQATVLRIAKSKQLKQLIMHEHMLIMSTWIFTTVAEISKFGDLSKESPASESFPMSQLFTSGGQSTGVSASASVLPMNIQGWFPLELTVRETIFDQAFLGRSQWEFLWLALGAGLFYTKLNKSWAFLLAFFNVFLKIFINLVALGLSFRV